MYFTHKMLIIVNMLQGPWLYTMTPIFYKTKTVLKNNSSQKTERLKRHINQRQWVDLVLTLIQPNKLHMYLLENLGNFNIAHFRILKNYWKLIDIIITLWIWIFCFCLAVMDLCCYAQAFSSCGKSGLFSSCGARASHCSGFYCWGPQLWGLQTSVVAAPRLSSYPTGLVTPQHVESSQTIDQIRVPYVLVGGFLTTGPSRKSCGYI